MNSYGQILLMILLCCSGLCRHAGAQQLGFEQLGVERGLLASETYNMIQDEQGYVYIATEYGMVKYNGSRFVPVCTNIPVREQVAYAFFRNNAGAYCFINSQFHFYTIRNDSAIPLQVAGRDVLLFPFSSSVSRLFTDSADNIYASTAYESCRYEAATGRWTVVTDRLLPGQDMVIERMANNSFISSCGRKYNHVIVRNSAYDGEYPVAPPDTVPLKYKVLETRHGLYLQGSGQVLRITKQKKLFEYRIHDALFLNVAADGHAWVGIHHGGVIELDTNLRPLHHYLDHLSIAHVLFDRQDGIWATSLEQGVFHCRDIHEFHYDNLEGFSGEVRFIKTIGDRLFAGTANGKLLMTTPAGKRVIDLGLQNIEDVIPWHQGYLVATTKDIVFLDTSFNLSIIVPQTAPYLLLPQRESFLSAGPTTLNRFSDRFELQQAVRTPARVKCLLSLSDSILAGTTKGLFVLRGNRFFIPPVLNPLRYSSISDLKMSRDGRIWISTRGDGLFLLAPGRQLVKVPSPSGIITHISFFKDSTILLSANTGLYGKHYAAATAAWDNLYEGAVLHALPYHNKIFIGTKHGLVAHDAAALFHRPPFPVYLSAVTAGRRRLPAGDIRIAHQEHELIFDFDVLSYSRPAPTIYYRLSGPQAGEGQASGTRLVLQNLPPGYYTLKIYAGYETPQPALVVPFYIRPAFWQTNTFLVLAVVAGLCLLIAGAYLLYRRTRSNAYKKAAIRRMLSEYKLTALKAQISPHFMSNSLAAIQQLILLNEVDKATRYLAMFSLLIRHVLQYSDKSLVPLSDELKIIELNVSLEQLRFSDRFIYEKDLAPDVDPHGLYIPPLITQPFIENAIWHGLLPLKGQRPSRLLVKVRREQDVVILSVIDNGVGRTAGTTRNDLRNDTFASRGIQLTQNRIDNLNQIYTSGKARIQIIDLYEEGAPAGTQIDIILPYIPDLAYENQHPQSHY